MKRIRNLLIWIGAMFCLPVGASASPVAWNFDILFQDGLTASGSFVYDADFNLFSSISLTTPVGPSYPGATYVAVHPEADASRISFVSTLAADLTGASRFDIGLSSPLTNAGGIFLLPPTFGAEWICETSDCGFTTPTPQVLRGITEGFAIAGTPVPTVPEPSSLILLGLGLAGMRAMRRVKTPATT